VVAGVLWPHDTVMQMLGTACSEDLAGKASAVIPGLAAMRTVLLVNALCECSCRELRVIDILSISQNTAGSRDSFL